MKYLPLKILTLLQLLFRTNAALSLYPFQLRPTLTGLNGTLSYPIEIMWDVDTDNSVVHFEIEIGASASPFIWFGFGFSDDGDWPNSDVCVYFPDDDLITDSHVIENGGIIADYQQDCLDYRQQILPDGRLVIRFERKLDTNDQNDVKIEKGTTQFAFLMGESMYMNTHSIHVHKSIVPDRILRQNTPPPKLPTNVKQVVIRNGPVDVPVKETTYWCTVVRLPRMFNKHHIIKYEPAIEIGHEHLVHHMEVYHCELNVNQMPRFNGECNWDSMPPPVKACRKVVAAWAMGAQAFIYPPDAGIPIGGVGYFPFVMIETHYNNPMLMSGQRDNSGIRIWYTPELRKHEAGILEVGLTYSDAMAIPPGQKAFALTGYCTPECTDTGISNSGMTLFASQLHSHTTGRKIVTALFRNGMQKHIVNEDRHYSPHWQEIRETDRITVYPGDSLVTTCVYDSSKRNNVTLGGFGISDEMCVNYIHYFPKQELEVCKSAISKDYLNQFFDYMTSHNLMRDRAVNNSAGVSYKNLIWNQERVEQLAVLYDWSNIDVECLEHKGKPFQGEWKSQKIPSMRTTI